MANNAKHAFGLLENVDAALSENKIDAFDVLFVKDSEGKPYVGWISKDGSKEIVDPYSGVAELETQLEAEIATKVDAETVQAMIEEYSSSTIEVIEF